MSIRIEHLLLENWRNFRSVDVDLGARTFVVGPNASGKSNLLDALRFVGEIARPGGSLAAAVKARSGMAHLRSLHARKASHVRVCVRVAIGDDAWTYDLSLTGTKGQPGRVEKERVTKNGADVFPPRPSEEDRRDPRLREQTHLEQLTQNGRFRELVDALASITTVHVVPQVAKTASRADHILLNDAPGSDFIEQLAQLPEKKQRGALRKIEKLLRIAVPQFSELRIERERKSGVPHLMAKYEHWRPQGGWQTEADFSDGTLRLIGFVWAIMNGKGPLLLEEPELSLHGAVVRQIPRILARAAVVQNRQVIITTHAEEMLDDRGIDPSEIILLTPTAEDTRVRSGKDESALVKAARARVPLGALAGGMTRPKGIEQLVLWETSAR